MIGHPVGHTLSPRMHNAAFAASGLDYVYLPMDVRPEDLPAAVSGLRALNVRGFNVITPHKEAILPLLDETARAAGAVNTVTIEERGMRGSNTDGSGFVEACASSGLTFAGARVPLVGAGGPSPPSQQQSSGRCAYSTGACGAPRGWRDALRSAYPEAGISVHDATDPEGAARGADVVVNATYLGMRDDDPLPIPVVSLGRNTVVCDAVYRPGRESRFIGLARALRDPRRTDAALPGSPEDMDRQRAQRARYEREYNHEPSESMDLVLWSSPGESP